MATCPGGPAAAATAAAASAPASAARSLRRTQPDTVPRHRVDVGLERRVVTLVVGGVVTDDGDERCAGAARVVQVGQAVAESGTEVQQRGARAAPAIRP